MGGDIAVGSDQFGNIAVGVIRMALPGLVWDFLLAQIDSGHE